ncbi:calcium-binding protein [Rhodobiaceae bacterium]|nr:calcium-binding protein [Rhodobiaceae bacterium]
MATINHSSGADIIVPSNNGTTYRGLGGDDTYIISNSIAANAAITIVDTSGTNKIQLVDGLSVASTKFAADAAQLTLSNGAVVTINGASNFDFDLGGNSTAGTTGSVSDFAGFAAGAGVATLPASGSVAGASNVSVNGTAWSTGGGSFTVTKSASSVDEGSSVTFTITASSAVASDTNFSWTVIGDNNGTTVDKASTTDVDVLSGSATIAAGSSSTTFNVTATSDAIVEGVEGIKVSVFDSNSTALSSNVILVNNAGSSATSQGFTLTTGVNEFTGGSGNDSFDASLNAGSLNDFDVLDGEGGTDTLTAKLEATAGLSVIPQISDIEVLQVTNTDANAGTDLLTINLAGTSGLTKLMNTTSSDSVTFADIENMVSLDLKSAAGTTTLDFQKAALSGASDNLMVSVKGTSSTTLALTDNDATQANNIETVTIDSLSVANTLADLQTTGVSATKLVVTGDKALTITAALDAEIASIDASGNSGGLTLSAAPTFANVSFTGGSGADTLTVAAGNTVITGGAGNDTVDFDATLNALDSYDGGDGIDTAEISGTGFTAVSVVGGLSNVEILKLSTAHTISLESDIGPTTFDFTDETDQILNLLDGYTNATTVDIGTDATNADKIVNTANVDLTVSARPTSIDAATTITGGLGTDRINVLNVSAGTVDFAATTGVDAITFIDYTAGVDVTLDLQTYTLDATYKAKVLTVDASSMDAGEVLTIDGDEAVTKLDVTSGAGADVLGLGTLADVVDSGAGNDSVTGTSGANVITLGDGNDTLLAGTGGESVSGGAGNDLFTLAGNLNSADTIDGGDGTDTLTITSGITTGSVAGGLSNIEVIEPLAALTIVANAPLGGATVFDFSDETNQVLTLTSAAAGGTFEGPVTVNLSKSAGAGQDDATSADTITNSKGVELNVVGNSVTFDAGLTVTGSATAVDTITVIADGDSTGAVLSGTTYINKVVVQDSLTSGEDVKITPKATDTTTPTLEIDGSALDAGTGAAAETLTLVGTSVTATTLNITGGDGPDSLYGGQKNDTIEGGTGADSINGNQGADNLSGGAGNDTFLVDALSDHYSSALGADTIDGGAGTDTITWTGATTASAAALANISNTEKWTIANDSSFTLSDAVLANNPGVSLNISGNGTITTGEDSLGASLMSTAMSITASSAGNLNLITSSGDDTFTFYATESLTADDSIDGNKGTDTIQVSNDDDLNAVGDATTAAFGANVKGIETILVVDAAVDNTAGDVTITIANGYTDAALTIDGSALDLNAVDLTAGESLNVTSSDTNVALTITGGAAHDTLTTNSGADSITAGGGNDTIESGGGKDTIYGGTGVDSIRAGDGVDFIDAGAGNDIIEVEDTSDFKTSGGVETVKGGDGTDTLKFTETNTALTITAPEVEHLYSIEKIQLANGTEASSITFGNATFTNLGAESISIIGNVADGGTNFIDASAVTNGAISTTGNTTTANADSIYGGGMNDTFTFSGETALEDGDVIDGNGGTDTIALNADATLAATIDFDDVSDVEVIKIVTVDGVTGGTSTIVIDDNDASALLDPAAITFDGTGATAHSIAFNNAGQDSQKTIFTITGGTKVDTLKGSQGNDIISGGGTTTGDSLYGMSGNDSITGNAGADSIDGGAGNDIMLSGAAGNDTILGGTGNDTIDGGSGTDNIDGGAGLDNITTGTGLDNLLYDAASDSTGATRDVIADFTQSVLNATTGAQVTAGDNIRITATLANDVIFTLADRGDVDSAGLTNSVLTGVAGDFVFSKDINTLYLDYDGNGSLNGNDFQFTITGASAFHDDDIDLYLTAGGNGESVTGGDGDDSLTGGAGADVLIGDGGADTIKGVGNTADTLVGGAGSDNITGLGGADKIYGDLLAADDTVGGGNDIISTGAGGDSVRAGAGNDSVTAGAGVDTIHGENGNDTLISAAGADSVYGGAGNDTITDAAGASSLEGGAGNDNITAGADNDTIKGGDGNDTIASDAGVDSLYGDAGNDSLTDAAGASSLNGGTGDDTLTGGAAIDTLTGGTGSDTFDLSAVAVAANHDNITDFADVGTTTSDIIKIAAANTTAGTTAGSTPTVLTVTPPTNVANGAAYTIIADSTGTVDIVEFTALPNAANATLGGAQDIVDSEELFKGLATAGAGNEIGKIVVNAAADKFYIVAYDNNDAFIYFADAGTGNTDLVKGEVNYVATISGTGNIAVAGLDATDFVLA